MKKWPDPCPGTASKGDGEEEGPRLWDYGGPTKVIEGSG